MKTFFYFQNTKNNNKEFRNTMKHFKVEYHKKKIKLFDANYTFINIVRNKYDFFWRLFTSGLRNEIFSFQIFTANYILTYPNLDDIPQIETDQDNYKSLIETNQDEILSIETNQDDEILSIETDQDDDT